MIRENLRVRLATLGSNVAAARETANHNTDTRSAYARAATGGGGTALNQIPAVVESSKRQTPTAYLNTQKYVAGGDSDWLKRRISTDARRGAATLAKRAAITVGALAAVTGLVSGIANEKRTTPPVAPRHSSSGSSSEHSNNPTKQDRTPRAYGPTTIVNSSLLRSV